MVKQRNSMIESEIMLEEYPTSPSKTNEKEATAQQTHYITA